MRLSRDEVAHIAALARLDLKPNELEAMARDLARILEYVERIAPLDPAEPRTDEAPAGDAALPGLAGDAALPGLAGTPLRPDVVLPSLSTAEALAPSADHDEAFFRVPAVIDRGTGNAREP